MTKKKEQANKQPKLKKTSPQSKRLTPSQLALFIETHLVKEESVPNTRSEKGLQPLPFSTLQAGEKARKETPISLPRREMNSLKESTTTCSQATPPINQMVSAKAPKMPSDDLIRMLTRPHATYPSRKPEYAHDPGLKDWLKKREQLFAEEWAEKAKIRKLEIRKKRFSQAGFLFTCVLAGCALYFGVSLYKRLLQESLVTAFSTFNVANARSQSPNGSSPAPIKVINRRPRRPLKSTSAAVGSPTFAPTPLPLETPFFGPTPLPLGSASVAPKAIPLR